MLLRSLSNYLPQGSIVCSHDPNLWDIGRVVKWLGLRARGHRFESGQDFLGSFGLIFEVVVGWRPTRSDLQGLSQIYGGHVRVVFMLFGTTVKYL